jgi:UDP-N-acetylglucosamine 3-dehydrogenase
VSSYTCAVVAAGSQGRVHAQGYLAAREAGARLVAVADPDGAAARELASDLRIPGVYTSYQDLLVAEHPHATGRAPGGRPGRHRGRGQGHSL